MRPIEDEALKLRMQQIAKGFYTERDGGPWYIVTPDHGDRIGEDFNKRDDARRLMCWVAGDPAPEGWSIEPSGDGRIAFHITVPGQYSTATLWARTVRKHFPNFKLEA